MVAEKDITGEIFGRWLVVNRVRDHNRSNMWLCKCECGTELIVNGYDLRKGSTKSCGCLRAEQMTGHGMHKTRLYSIWSNMVSRCRNKESPFYGGRGITVCESWLTFENFMEDMHESYLKHCEEFGELNTSLDRVDVNGNYELSNVTWATKKEQVANRRTNKNNTSGHSGINWSKSRKKWRVRLSIDSKDIHIGMFGNLQEAIFAKESALKQFEGER